MRLRPGHAGGRLGRDIPEGYETGKGTYQRYYFGAGDRWQETIIGTRLDCPEGKYHGTEGSPMAALSERMETASAEIEAAYDRFDVKRKKFRSEINNEVASVAASAGRISSEFAKVSDAVSKIERLMISPEMLSAIANAERLAAALQSISEIQSSRLTFAVIDQSPKADQ